MFTKLIKLEMRAAARILVPVYLAALALSGACALINGITPTSGVLMGGISISRIEFSTWVKYIWKVLLAMLLVHVVILSVAMVIF